MHILTCILYAIFTYNIFSIFFIVFKKSQYFFSILCQILSGTYLIPDNVVAREIVLCAFWKPELRSFPGPDADMPCDE